MGLIWIIYFIKDGVVFIRNIGFMLVFKKKLREE